MIYRELGKTGEKVSQLGFGCMRLPIIDGVLTNIDEEKAIEMIHYAIENGVNYFDTAYPYHSKSFEVGGESEPLLAKALRGGYREKVKIATKLPSWLVYTREDMDRILNEQLERLETDHIDFYLIHSLSDALWENLKKLDIFDFMNKALKDGRIRHIGFSFHDKLDVFKRIVDDYDWEFCQIQYNYIDEDFQAGREGYEYATKKGLGLITMESLRGGSLADKLPKEAVEVFKEAAPEKTPVEWALRWLWNHENVDVVLSGMTTLEQVVENIRVANDAKANSMTDKELSVIEKVKDIIKSRTKVNCTACGYCMPCPTGVNIPENFKFLNQYYLFDSDQSKRMIKMMFHKMLTGKEKASNCIECGKCLSHCPQKIDIPTKLKKVKEDLEG